MPLNAIVCESPYITELVFKSACFNDLISLYIGDIYSQDTVNSSFKAHIDFYKSLFKIIKCELYETNSDNNITFKFKSVEFIHNDWHMYPSCILNHEDFKFQTVLLVRKMHFP